MGFSSGKLDAEDLPDESLKFVAPVVSLFLSEVLLELQTPQPFSVAQMQEVIYLVFSCDLNASVVVVVVVVVLQRMWW